MKPHQFEQLFLIFIDNAIKYDVKNKKIKVKTRLKNKQKIIEITDRRWYSRGRSNFIFDRFYQWINLVQEVKAVMDSDYLLLKKSFN